MTTWWIQILSAISADRQFCSISFHYLNNEGKCAISQELICRVNILIFCEYCYMWMLCMNKVILFSVSKLPMNQEAVIFGPKLAFLPNVVKLLNVILLIGPSWSPTVGLMLVQRSRPIKSCICQCNLQSPHNGLSAYRYFATVHRSASFPVETYS